MVSLQISSDVDLILEVNMAGIMMAEFLKLHNRISELIRILYCTVQMSVSKLEDEVGFGGSRVRNIEPKMIEVLSFSDEDT